jgi:hypothetical protein
MIGEDLAGHLEGAAMLVVATRDAAFRPAIGRALGAKVRGDGTFVEICISRAQWADVVKNLGINAPIALTASEPSSYRTYQIKGNVESFGPADPDDRARVDRYISDVTSVLTELGVERHQIAVWLAAEDLVRISFRPRDVFLQTPGPSAGLRMSGVPR